MPLPIHISAVQYSTDMYDRVANTDKALHLLDDAAHSSDLVLLPEMSFTGYWPGKDMESFAEPVPGPLTAIVSEIAVIRNAYICFGIAERDGDKIYNAAVLVGADGNIAGKHRKVHLFQTDTESGFSPGDTPEVFDTHLGKIGILIGFDLFHIESAKSLAVRGVQVVLVPAIALATPPDTIETTLRSWEAVLEANAKNARCHMVWADKTGMDRGLHAVGNSMVLDRDGGILARAGMGEEVLRAEIVPGSKSPQR